MDTDAQGSNDYVYVTALVQVLKLQIGESPFYADYGIPAVNSVRTQVPPDLYVARTQQRYAQFFASLIVSRVDVPPATLKFEPEPTYKINVLLHQGTRMQFLVTGVPT